MLNNIHTVWYREITGDTGEVSQPDIIDSEIQSLDGVQFHSMYFNDAFTVHSTIKNSVRINSLHLPHAPPPLPLFPRKHKIFVTQPQQNIGSKSHQPEGPLSGGRGIHST
jgi:hypothetical protein